MHAWARAASSCIGRRGDDSRRELYEPETASYDLEARGADRHAVAGADGGESGPAPRPFVPRTVQVYVFAVVSPATMIGLTAAALVLLRPPFEDVQVAV